MGSLNALNLAYIFIYIRYTQMVWCPYKKSYKEVIYYELPSINMAKISRLMKMVEIITITENSNVQIGSTILHFSLYQMRADATRTPIDWIKSPMTCMNAALKLISSDKCSSTAKLLFSVIISLRWSLLSCVWTWK